MPGLSTLRVVVALVWLAMPLWFETTKFNSKNGSRNDVIAPIDSFVRSLTSYAKDGRRSAPSSTPKDGQQQHFESIKPRLHNSKDTDADTDKVFTYTKRGHHQQRALGQPPPPPPNRAGRRPEKVPTEPPTNLATLWTDNHFLKLGLNPRIEVGIDILHDDDAWKTEAVPTVETIVPIYSDRNRPKPTLKSAHIDAKSDTDLCQRWLDCPGDKRLVELARLHQLPSCPCDYSFHIHYEDEVWDRGRRRLFRWRDASGPHERMDTFRPGAHWCIRSLISGSSGAAGTGDNGGGMATQQCCYDQRRKLLTRGAGAGTPYVVSPEVSRDLHHKVDIVPWLACRGDWTRYHIRRKPNNGLHCPVNPRNRIYLKEVQKAKNY